MNIQALAGVIREKARDMEVNTEDLHDAKELLRVLARIIEGHHVEKLTLIAIFGAPGDWGYGTRIGAALVAP